MFVTKSIYRKQIYSHSHSFIRSSIHSFFLSNTHTHTKLFKSCQGVDQLPNSFGQRKANYLIALCRCPSALTEGEAERRPLRQRRCGGRGGGAGDPPGGRWRLGSRGKTGQGTEEPNDRGVNLGEWKRRKCPEISGTESEVNRGHSLYLLYFLGSADANGHCIFPHSRRDGHCLLSGRRGLRRRPPSSATAATTLLQGGESLPEPQVPASPPGFQAPPNLARGEAGARDLSGTRPATAPSPGQPRARPLFPSWGRH